PRATKGPVRARDTEQANLAGSDGPASGVDPDTEFSSSVRPKRYRGSRGGRRHRGSGRASTATPAPVAVATPEEEPKPKRRRGSRGGRKHRKPGAKAAPAQTAP